MLILIGFQVGVFNLLTTKSWFKPVEIPGHNYNPKETVECQETTTMYAFLSLRQIGTTTYQTKQQTTNRFLFSNFQYVIVVVAFSIGKPFRKPLYTNSKPSFFFFFWGF
jgi:magnesium-transporting ATPase (P-type)